MDKDFLLAGNPEPSEGPEESRG